MNSECNDPWVSTVWAAMKRSRGPTVPRLELSDDDYRMSPYRRHTIVVALSQPSEKHHLPSSRGPTRPVPSPSWAGKCGPRPGRRIDRQAHLHQTSMHVACCLRSNLVRTTDRQLWKRFIIIIIIISWTFTQTTINQLNNVETIVSRRFVMHS